MTVDPPVRVLGPVTVRTAAGDRAALAGALPRRLLVALALAGAEGRSATGLIDDLWQDEPPRNPRGALQMLVSRVRQVAADGVVLSTATGYRVAGSDLLTAEQADAGGALDALALWTGEPGAEVDDDALAADLSARASRARQRLLRVAAERLAHGGRSADAVPLLQELVAAAPLDGVAVGQLMRARTDAGDAAAALADFAAHRSLLADALGADPDPALVRLHAELLRAPAATGAQLIGVRAATTPLLGRDADVVALTAAIPDHRLTSIIGTGGLGKTRLAHAAAVAVADRFDRIVFVELAGAQAEEDVALVVGATAGARPAQAPRRLGDPAPADLATRTREALAAGRTLLVLDNCEHVVDVAARLAADLLAALPDLSVLATSRIPLLLAGEHVVALQPLPVDGAGAALFVARATAARPGVALDPAVVLRVCTRLDGLPLAIELAAARLRSMGLAELDRRLEDRFAVLVGGDRAAPERHRTLLAVIDWSRRLLSPAAGDALALLAVFPDGFTADSAADLLSTGALEPARAGATDVLTELVDQSLLVFRDGPGAAGTGGDGRYRMLETVREFGLRALAEAGRQEQGRRALDRWALRFVRRSSEGLLLGRDPGTTRTVVAEEETLLVVLRGAPADRGVVAVAVYGLLAEHWAYRGDFEAAQDAAPSVLPVAARRPADAQEAAEAVRTLVFLAAVALATRRPGGVRALALLRRALGAVDGEGGFWAVVGRELLLPAGPGGLVGAADRLAAHPDPVIRAVAMAIRAQLLENRGELRSALALLQRIEVLAVQHDLHWLRFFSRMNAVSILGQRGEHRVALDAARALRAEAVLLDAGMNLQQIDWMIGTDLVALGGLDEAQAVLTDLAAATERSRSGDGADMHAIALAGLADVATARGDAALALARWDEVVTGSRRTAWPWRVLVLASSIAGRSRLGAQAAELVPAHRRLRAMVLALVRLDPEQADAPVIGGGLLGLVPVLRHDDPPLAAALTAIALALGARRDFPGLHLVAGAAAAADVPPDEAMRQAVALLRSPAARR